MEKLSLKKKLLVIRLYTEGYSYSEIAARAGVGKGSIGTIITDLKAGRFPQFGDLSEHLELIRELAVDLRQSGLTPVQASVGVMVLSRLHKLGVEPSEIEGLSALYRTLTTEGTDMQSFIRVALSLEEIRKRTGLSVEELEIKVKDLEESASRLEPLAKEVMEQEARLTELAKQRESLAKEVSELEEHHEALQEKVREKEQRETELSNRVMDFEDRAQRADERLSIARKDLQTLSDIGMSPDNLSAFAQRVKVVAQRHTMKPEVIYSKLMDELEQLDEGLGLDTIVNAKNEELRRIENTIVRAKEESSGIISTNEKIRQERSSLRAAQLEEQRYLTKDIKSINTIARNTIVEFKRDIESVVGVSIVEVNKLSDQALQLGKELGQYNEMIESNKWLKGLLALVKDDEVEPEKVRVIGITVLRSILSWMKHYYENSNSPWWLVSISNLIGELERWKP